MTATFKHRQRLFFWHREEKRGQKKEEMTIWEGREDEIKLKKKKKALFHSISPATHPVFVVHDVAQHVVHIQDASISVLQPVDLHPVAGVLQIYIKKKRLGY